MFFKIYLRRRSAWTARTNADTFVKILSAHMGFRTRPRGSQDNHGIRLTLMPYILASCLSCLKHILWHWLMRYGLKGWVSEADAKRNRNCSPLLKKSKRKKGTSWLNTTFFESCILPWLTEPQRCFLDLNVIGMTDSWGHLSIQPIRNNNHKSVFWVIFYPSKSHPGKKMLKSLRSKLFSSYLISEWRTVYMLFTGF